MLKGNIGILALNDIIIWQGWVVYYWDMNYAAALFCDKPKKDKDCGWGFENSIPICPVFLRTCGVDAAWETDDRDFYYGEKQSDGHGQHNPIRIKLTMPRALLEQLGIDTTGIPSHEKSHVKHKR